MSADVTLISAFSGPNGRRYLPAGLLYVAAALKRAGLAAEVRDWQLHDDPEPCRPQSFLRLVEGCADVVGISCMADFLPQVVLWARALKAKRPGVRVVLGGPGPAGVAAELLAAFPELDAVVRGEGELALPSLLASWQRGGRGLDAVRGVTWRLGGEVHHNPARPRVDDLNALPWPDYDLVRLGDYDDIAVVTARGCPYRCTFCDVAQLWPGPVRYRHLDGVLGEVEYLVRGCGRRDLTIADDTFGLKAARVAEFCARVRRDQLDFGWSCFGRVDIMTEDLVREMAAAGCRHIFYGLESGSDDVLREAKKGFDVATALETVTMTLKHCQVTASFIWGYPFETFQDFQQTLAAVAYLTALGAHCDLQRLAPLPLSPLYGQHEDGLELVRDRTFGRAFDTVHQGAYDAGLEDLIAAHPRLFPSFFRYRTPSHDEKNACVWEFARHWYV